MSASAKLIDGLQGQWAGDRVRDAKWGDYVASVSANLFKPLHILSEGEFTSGDGSELIDSGTRPAKMRALSSSSALAVNFFDSWRDTDKTALSEALGLPAPIVDLRFEFKTRLYPVRPRSPNLDLLLRLQDGQRIGVESKFSEPFRSDDGHGVLSARYFPASGSLWSDAHLEAAQRMAMRLRPEWIHLDAPQLLKHLLGLANDPDKPSTLLYLWFDTGKPDAAAHHREIDSFSREVAGDAVKFRALTYQSTFGRLQAGVSPINGWRSYMQSRYFPLRSAV